MSFSLKTQQNWPFYSLSRNEPYLILLFLGTIHGWNIQKGSIESPNYERIRKIIYKTRDLARADIFDYIEVFYNRARRHSHLDGVSPEPFEQGSS